MNIKALIKKYGILMLVAIIFIAAIVYFAIDSNKGIINGKKVNGKEVVVSLDGYNVTADDLYDEMLNSGNYGGYTLYTFYERAVVNAVGTKTDDMVTTAELNRDSIISQYKSTYGDSYKDYLKIALYNSGISDESEIVDYYVNYYMLQALITEYIENNKEELFAPYYEEYQPRYVSHILVQCEDPKNPTDEEKAKMQAVEEALANGTAFEDVAKEYSDDGSASSGGALGYVTSQTSFVEPFLNMALELNTGEQSDWVETEYGFHIILVTESGEEAMRESDDANSALLEYYPNIQLTVVKNAAKDLDIVFADESIKSIIDEFVAGYIGE